MLLAFLLARTVKFTQRKEQLHLKMTNMLKAIHMQCDLAHTHTHPKNNNTLFKVVSFSHYPPDQSEASSKESSDQCKF